MRKILLLTPLILCSIVVAGVPGRSIAQNPPPWSTFHGDAQRSGSSAVSGPGNSTDANLTAIGNWQLPGSISDSPALDGNGVAYVGTTDGKVYALDPSHPGPTKWSFKTGGKVRSSPTVAKDNSAVYVGSDDGHVYALATSDGHQLWSKDLQSPIAASPLLSNDGNSLYIPNQGGTIYSLKTSTGDESWKCTVGGAIPQSLSLSQDGSTIYAAASNGGMYGIPNSGCGTGTTGSAFFYLSGPPLSTPSIDQNGNIYINTSRGEVVSYSPANTAPRWTYTIFNRANSTTSEAFFNGQAILGAANGFVYSIDQSNGQQKWQYQTGGPIQSSPAIARGNGRIYVGSADGYVYALDQTGTLINKRFMGSAVDASPALGADGSVWAASEGGLVLRLNALPAPPPTLVPPTAPPVTPTAIPTATALVTSTPTATITATATSTPSALPLSISLTAQVKAGSRQTIGVTTSPNTDVRLRVDYPNGDHQSKKVTTDASGNATYSFKQGGSKITRNNVTATVTAKAGTGNAQNVKTSTYKIGFGSIDVSAEPRTQAVGKVVDIFVHMKKNTKVLAYVVAPNGRVVTLRGKTGSKGFSSIKYKIPRGLVSGKKRKVNILAKPASGRPNISANTTFTVK